MAGIIEPIPWDELPDESRALIEAGLATGMYTTPVPMQVVAYSSAALRSMHDGYTATFRKGVLDERLVELLRLRSAEAGGCATCMASRKDPTTTRRASWIPTRTSSRRASSPRSASSTVWRTTT